MKNWVGRKWVARLLALAALVLVGLGLSTQHAAADSDNCDPPARVPDTAGAGVQGGIDDRPTGGSGDTLYEQYGWSGLRWHTCDLGEDGWITMPDAAKDPGAFIDTSFGSVMMGGASTLAAFMTQLAEWVSDPGALLAPIDGAMVSITSAVEESVWGPWATVIVVGAACCVAWWATKGSPRRAFRTVMAILFAALAVAALGRTWDTPEGPKPGAVAMGQFFDSAASDVIGEVSSNVAGGSTANIAYGATLYDEVLVPLWVEGAVGRGAGDAKIPDTLAYDIFRANTMSWEEISSGSVTPETKKDAYVRVARILDGEENGPYPANAAQYDQLRGVGGDRAGVGFQAFLTMIMISFIRIPASIFVLMGLIVIRFVVMFIPIWALFAIIEKTRPTAITAGKMILAAVYNAAIFGVFGVVYTAAVAAIIEAPEPAGFTWSKLMLIGALTIVVWVVSKPFRSVTVPATGDVLANANQGMSSGLGMVKSFGSMFLANKLANRGLERDNKKQQGQVPDGGVPPPSVDQSTAEAPIERRDYSVEQMQVVPHRQRPTIEFAPVRELESIEEIPPRRELPPGPPSAPVPGPNSPVLPPGEPVKATVPVEIDHQVIEPTRMLEISDPEIQEPEPARVPVPVLTTMEKHPATGQWNQREWKEVWRPPSDESNKPIWEDRDRWKDQAKPWTPPAWNPPAPAYQEAAAPSPAPVYQEAAALSPAPVYQEAAAPQPPSSRQEVWRPPAPARQEPAIPSTWSPPAGSQEAATPPPPPPPPPKHDGSDQR